MNHFHACGIGHIERRDDACQALQVVGVIGNDQSIGAWVHIDRVVGADQGPENGHQVVGILMVQLKNLCDDLPVRGRYRARRYTTTLQFGIGFWHHQIKSGRLHQGIALCAQLRGKQTQRLRGCHWNGAGECDGAFHSRVDHHVVSRQRGQSFGHSINVSVGEIQGHRFWLFLT